MNFGGVLGGFLDHFGLMLSSKVVLETLGELCSLWKWIFRVRLDHFGRFWRGFGKDFGDILVSFVDVNVIMNVDMIL